MRKGMCHAENRREAVERYPKRGSTAEVPGKKEPETERKNGASAAAVCRPPRFYDGKRMRATEGKLPSALEESGDMQDWPLEGSGRELDAYAIVRLSDPKYDEE